jgi:hypothetical protein
MEEREDRDTDHDRKLRAVTKTREVTQGRPEGAEFTLLPITTESQMKVRKWECLNSWKRRKLRGMKKLQTHVCPESVIPG